MKVLLLKDVFKLGRAGDVKRVADGYGRNYLLPQGLAVLATPGALKQVDRITTQATVQRNALNEELGEVAEQLNGTVLSFTARASETGKLYGSITTQMIAESISEKTGVEVNKRQVFTQPLRSLGEHNVQIRLTVDLVPEVTVLVNSEGEEPEEVIIQEPILPETDEDQDEQETEGPSEPTSEVEEFEAEEESEITDVAEEYEAEEESDSTIEEEEPEIVEESETTDVAEESEAEEESEITDVAEESEAEEEAEITDVAEESEAEEEAETTDVAEESKAEEEADSTIEEEEPEVVEDSESTAEVEELEQEPETVAEEETAE
jgi:large subunit ribosomal protein L9